jgi:AmmeMemoRadiSam system protein A
MIASSEEDDARGALLLALARGALEEELVGEARPAVAAAWLQEPGASFVTRRLDGELCGCIGSLEPYRPLADDVRANALAAAFRDPRFPPLEAGELPRLRIEVSLLSEQEPVEWTDESDLVRQLRPGLDGLVLEHDGHRGTFLPAVWRQLPRPEQFLRQLKRKAGLAEDFWAPDVRVSRYTVDSWAEPAG